MSIDAKTLLNLLYAIAGIAIALIGVIYGQLHKRIKDNKDDADKKIEDNKEDIDEMQKELMRLHKDFATKGDISEIKGQLQFIIEKLVGVNHEK